MTTQYLEILGTTVGLIYLWLEFKASIYLWLAGMVMPAIYMFVYYRSGLYADSAMNVYYFLAAVYGWLVWRFGGKKKEGEKQELPITHTPGRVVLPLALVFAAAWLLIAFLLIRYTNSNVPWYDAFTTALSIVGLWMLARKSLEQWLVWLVVDVVCACLYVYKGIYFTAGLYTIYTLLAVWGYFNWKKMMAAQDTPQS